MARRLYTRASVCLYVRNLFRERYPKAAADGRGHSILFSKLFFRYKGANDVVFLRFARLHFLSHSCVQLGKIMQKYYAKTKFGLSRWFKFILSPFSSVSQSCLSLNQLSFHEPTSWFIITFLTHILFPVFTFFHPRTRPLHSIDTSPWKQIYRYRRLYLLSLNLWSYV